MTCFKLNTISKYLPGNTRINTRSFSKEPISADRQSLVVVQENYPQANGQYQFIDGVHRAVNMVLSGETQAHTYIAKYKEKQSVKSLLETELGHGEHP